MYLRSDDRGGTGGSGTALRTAVFGGFALVLFGVLFFRLWTLQIVNGEEYLAEANNNRTREYRVPAPRGAILDRDGEVLVDNRTSLALQVNPRKLAHGERERRAELAQLADLAGMTLRQVRRTMHEELEEAPAAPVTLKSDVGRYLVYYLQENQDRFPGVEVRRVFVRDYPHGTLAAHLFGNVGEVSEEQLKEDRYRDLQPGDIVGKEGVEDSYDEVLRGRPGATVIQVDSMGRPTPGGQLKEVEPEPGENLRLTIDAGLQEAGDAALSEAGLPGGYVAMDVRDGSILAMGSNPTFDPAIFTKPTLTQSQVDDLYRDPVSSPITNRAIAGAYPTGSTFKPITSIAALASGAVTPSEIIEDDGAFTLGGITFENAGGVAHGPIAMERALEVSSDVYYYTLGDRMYPGNALQEWAHRLGIGRETGIDVPGELPGLLPTRAWHEELRREGLALEDRPWSAGDNVNLSVGQGSLQAAPLQMAVAYAAIANGGTVPRPHVGLQVEDAEGRVLREVAPPPARQVRIDPEWRETILAGLHAAAQSGDGTSYEVFGGFPIPVAGKTGTAERPPYGDQSWYVVLAPYPDPEIVVAVTFEEGGFGAHTAAPAALKILSEHFEKEAKPVEGGGAIE
ncbi:MAG TPA: penicillin-binding protein 2 [Solirubrobacterales bacterium]|nr:penicillin-binding protein 2 [Solirubrobacterales bacterium]